MALFGDIIMIKKTSAKVKTKKNVSNMNTNLKQILNSLETKYGEGIIASANEILDAEKVSTKILLLDFLLKGGIPTSSINVFYGTESSGKSLVALTLASVFTAQKKYVAIIDHEHSYTNQWAKANNIDTEYIVIAQPDQFEKGIDITDTCVRSKEFALVIFDSLTSAIPAVVADKSAYDKHMGIQAKLNTDLCQKLTAGLQPENLKNPEDYNNTIVILIGHLREKIGVVYGNPEILPGGHALRHHSHNILRFRKGDIIYAAKKAKNKEEEESKELDTEDKKNKKGVSKKVVGREMKIFVEKAKFSPPLVSGVTEFLFDPPKFNNSKTLILYGTQLGIIKSAGAMYEYGDIKVRGKKKLVETLKEKPEILKELKEKIIQEIK